MDIKVLILLLPFFLQGAFVIGEECEDKLSYCSSFTREQCKKYVVYMKKNCKKTCGYCEGPAPTVAPDCEDKEPSYCPGWRSAGYCEPKSVYHEYMKTNCMKTCGFCARPTTLPTTKPIGSTRPTTLPTTRPTGSSVCSVSRKLQGCSFDSDSCDFIDVPFDDDHDFKTMSSGGQNGGYYSASGRGKAQLIYPLDLLVSHNGNYGAMCMEFYYRLNSASSTVTIYEVRNAKNYPKQTKARLSGSQSSWKKHRFTFSASQSNHILIEANPYSGSVDIDSVRFCDGSCS